jgi:hypothetical protein
MKVSSGETLAIQKLFACKMKANRDISSMSDVSLPRLAPPGAGLPLPELLVARFLFALRHRTASAGQRTDRFRQERAAIEELVRACPAGRRRERVLIPRIPGLEDSSRHWSVWMTLDHLRITNEAFAGVVCRLQEGVVPPGRASTAAVKPSETADATVEAAFARSCDAVLAAVSTGKSLRTAVRFPHPWFGPLDASGWHSLAGLHLGIHREQLRRILRGLTD